MFATRCSKCEVEPEAGIIAMVLIIGWPLGQTSSSTARNWDKLLCAFLRRRSGTTRLYDNVDPVA